MNLCEQYQNQWQLGEIRLLTKTLTSNLYLTDSPNGKSVLKIFTEIGQEDEKGSLVFYRCFNAYPCVKVFQADKNAVLMEALTTPNLYSFSARNQEQRASEVFVQLIREIQDAKVDPALEDFSKLFSILKDGQSHSMDRAKYWAHGLLKTQERELVLHGDLHHENILKNSEGEFVCFDPKGYRGDPAYELATTLKNPWDYPAISHNLEILKQRIDYFSRELSLSKERIFKFFYIYLCLSILWADEDEASSSHQSKLLEKIDDSLTAFGKLYKFSV